MTAVSMTAPEFEDCTRCGHSEHWLVSDMREHGLAAYVAATLRADQFALSTVICRGCGAMRWYANSAHSSPYPSVDRQPCLACGSGRRVRANGEGAPRRLLSLPLGYTDGATAGRLDCDTCSDCGLVEWRVSDVAWMGAAPQPQPERIECGRCLSGKSWRVTPLIESGGDRLPALVIGAEVYGRLELRLCGGCGLCTWKAREVKDLFTDGMRVRLLTGRPRAASSAGGPYR